MKTGRERDDDDDDDEKEEEKEEGTEGISEGTGFVMRD